MPCRAQSGAAPFPYGGPCPTGDRGAEREGGVSATGVPEEGPYPIEQCTKRGPAP